MQSRKRHPPTHDRLSALLRWECRWRLSLPHFQIRIGTIFVTAVPTLKESTISRKHYSLSKQVVAAAALALGASGVALADDSSMNPFTGDSYAYFNGGQNVGNFNNVARALRMQAPDATTGRPNKDEQKAE